MIYGLGSIYQEKALAVLDGQRTAFDAVGKPGNPLEAALKLVASEVRTLTPEQFETLYKEFCYNRLFSEILLSRSDCPTNRKNTLKLFLFDRPGYKSLAEFHALAKDNKSLYYYSPDPEDRYRQRFIFGRLRSGDYSIVDPDIPEALKIDLWIEIGKPSFICYLASLEKLDQTTFVKMLSCHASVRKKLAIRTDLPSDILHRLVQDKTATVRQLVARNLKTTTDDLAQLLKDKNKAVAEAARLNPNSPITTTTKNSDSLSLLDVKTYLLDPKTSVEKIDILSQNTEAWVRASCVLHPNLSESALHALAIDKDPIVRKYAATHSALTEENALALAEDKAEVQRALARNEKISIAVQKKLLLVDDELTHIGLANHTEISEIWQELLEISYRKNVTKLKKDQIDGLFYYLFKLLSDPTTKALSKFMNINWGNELFLYRLLIRHPNVTDYEEMISNLSYYWPGEFKNNPVLAMKLLEDAHALDPYPMTDWKTKHQLECGSPHYLIRYHLKHSREDYGLLRGIATAWRLPFTDQLELTQVRDANTKKYLASRRDIDEVCLHWLALDELASVRELVARQATSPMDLVRKLADDKNAKVRMAARNHKSYAKARSTTHSTTETLRNKGRKPERIKMAKSTKDAYVLEDLSQDNRAEVREAVAKNPRTPLPVLLGLVTDPDTDVLKALASCMRVGDELFEAMYAQPGESNVLARLKKLAKMRYSDDIELAYIEDYAMDCLKLKNPKLDCFIAKRIRSERLVPQLKNSTSQCVILAIHEEFSTDELVAKVPYLDIVGRKTIIRPINCDERVLDAVLSCSIDDKIAKTAIRNTGISKKNALKVMSWSIYTDYSHFCQIDWKADLGDLFKTHPAQAGIIVHNLLSKDDPVARRYLRSKDPNVRNVLLVHSRLKHQWLTVFFENPATENERCTLVEHQILDTEAISVLASQGLSSKLIESIIANQPIGSVWLTYITHLLNETLIEALDKAINDPESRFGNRYFGKDMLTRSWRGMEQIIERMPPKLWKHVCDHSSNFSAELVNHCRTLV